MDSPSDLTPEASPIGDAGGDSAPRGRLSRRTRAWLGMGAVLVALVLLAMLSGPDGYDPNAPPPAAGDSAAGEASSSGGLAVGQDAPLEFTLKDTGGVDVNLASFKGKVILINFWATWCGPCRVEIPHLIELQQRYRDDLVILGIDVLDEFDRVPKFAQAMKVNYPMLNGNGRKEVEEAYGPMWGLPTTVIVDRQGKVSKKHSGIASKEQFEQYITAVL